MKKVLVTGGAGSLGMYVIKYLLAEGKYEITALDLPNQSSQKKLNRYRKRVNIIYGDVLNRSLMESLIKENDYIIHLASVLPPFSEYKKNLADIIEKDAIENIVRAINFYNPNCHLIYASTTSIYDEDNVTVKSKVSQKEGHFFDNAKLASEMFIENKCPKYTILRLPLILGDLNKDNFIYNVKLNSIIECITKEDAAYAFSSCINQKVNKKILNIGGGKTFCLTYKELLIKIMKYHGLSFKCLNALLFLEKNYSSPVLLDSDKSNELLNFRNDSLDSYFMRQKRRSKKRVVAKFFGKIFIFFFQKKGTK